jgi:hypothetical protein
MFHICTRLPSGYGRRWQKLVAIWQEAVDIEIAKWQKETSAAAATERR